MSSCKEHEDDAGHDDALTDELTEDTAPAHDADLAFFKRATPRQNAHATAIDARAGLGGRSELSAGTSSRGPRSARGLGSIPSHRAVSSDYALGGADVFDRTFQIASTEAGLAVEALARHLPIFRRTVGAGQTVLLVARCGRLDQPNTADHLIVITRDRVVITSESRSLHRARLHLNAAVAALMNVRWQPDAGLTAVEFAATALDGVRERFLIEAPDAAGVSHVDAVLGYVFRPAGSRRLNPVDPVMPSWMNPAGAF